MHRFTTYLLDFCISLFSVRYRKGLGKLMHLEGACKQVSMFLSSRILPSLLKRWDIKKHNAPVQPNLIVSFTSFPARIDSLWKVVMSMLMQTLLPEKIVLYLSKEQFPNTFDDLPQSLLRLREFSVNIKFVADDLRSHKKFYYALAEFPNSYVVTIDDDIYYHSTLLENLYKETLEKKSVICNWARSIRWDRDTIGAYNTWTIQDGNDIEKNQDLFLLSGGGTIFPPSSFYKDILNKELFLSLTPNADDIWLNAMLRLQGTTICRILHCYAPLSIKVVKGNTLWMSNIVENDKQLAAIISYYKRQGLCIWCKEDSNE